MKRIILASASPRRKELLEQIGLKFEVDPADYPEKIVPGLKPAELVRQISLEKARRVAPKYRDAVIIAADTVGLLDGELIGKPQDAAAARKMLGKLSGRCHIVITGYTIVDTATDKTITNSVETTVCFRKLATSEIEAYVASGEPLGKAGGYAVQGRGALLVEKIEGDYFNVVGLPVSALAQSLKEFGIQVLANAAAASPAT